APGVGEHIQALFRLMVWLGSLAGDFQAAPLRSMLLVVHGLGALAAAGLVFCWTRSRPASWFAGLLYFGLSDYLGITLVVPASGFYCLSGGFLALTLLALVVPIQDRALALGLAIAAAVMCILGLNWAAISLAGIPVFCWLVGARLPGRPVATAAIF